MYSGASHNLLCNGGSLAFFQRKPSISVLYTSTHYIYMPCSPRPMFTAVKTYNKRECGELFFLLPDRWSPHTTYWGH